MNEEEICAVLAEVELYNVREVADLEEQVGFEKRGVHVEKERGVFGKAGEACTAVLADRSIIVDVVGSIGSNWRCGCDIWRGLRRKVDGRLYGSVDRRVDEGHGRCAIKERVQQLSQKKLKGP